MKDFANKLAVITGAGSGIGRELALALVREGADLAMCDVIQTNLEDTLTMCESEAAQGRRMSIHLCDVADESAVLAFRDATRQRHDTGHIDLLFNNAGVGGTESFVTGSRERWERTFNTCWFGVYYCARAFMPMLVASTRAHLINISSVNGFWASLGRGRAHTSYSAAKFAVKGFSEALIEDLSMYAPHVKVSVVMPGHIGTGIVGNSMTILAGEALQAGSEQALAFVREQLRTSGTDVAALSDDDVIAAGKMMADGFRSMAPMTPAQAATEILQGVRDERWRILVGEDAVCLDEMVRTDPEGAYGDEFFARMQQQDVLRTLTSGG